MNHPLNPDIIPMLELLQDVSTHEEARLISRLLGWKAHYYTFWSSVYFDSGGHACFLFDRTIEFPAMCSNHRLIYPAIRSYLEGLKHESIIRNA